MQLSWQIDLIMMSLLAVGASKDAWSVKSKVAVFLALVVKRQGQELWQAIQPQLLGLAQQGPLQAEMVRRPSDCCRLAVQRRSFRRHQQGSGYLCHAPRHKVNRRCCYSGIFWHSGMSTAASVGFCSF